MDKSLTEEKEVLEKKGRAKKKSLLLMSFPVLLNFYILLFALREVISYLDKPLIII